jgi:hypothetical protein
LTEPKTVAGWPPGKRETVITILADLILSEYYRQWRAERSITAPPDPPCDLQRGEGAG